MAELSGGGTKDAKFAAAQTAAAQVFLDNGLSLSEATEVIDRLMPAAGAARVHRIVQLAHAANKWHELQQLCHQFHAPLPPTPARLERAQKSAQAVAKRKGASFGMPAAASLTLQDAYFHNADGTQAKLLKTLYPGCSGVCLLDKDAAPAQLKAYAQSCTDELACVILGTSCPDPSSCSGEITAPAWNSQHEPILIRGCLHQLGDRKVSTKCEHAAQVTFPDTCCVAFSAHRDDWCNSSD